MLSRLSDNMPIEVLHAFVLCKSSPCASHICALCPLGREALPRDEGGEAIRTE